MTLYENTLVYLYVLYIANKVNPINQTGTGGELSSERIISDFPVLIILHPSKQSFTLLSLLFKYLFNFTSRISISEASSELTLLLLAESPSVCMYAHTCIIFQVVTW